MHLPKPMPTSLPPISHGEFEHRQQAALEAALKVGHVALVVWGRGSTNSDGSQDLLYLSNHMSAVSHIPDSDVHRARGHAALVLSPGRDPILITDAYDLDPDTIPVRDIRFSTSVDVTTGETIRSLGLNGGTVARAGNGGLLHSAAVAMDERMGPDLVAVPADGLIAELRLIKTDAEVALLRDASRIGCQWMNVVMQAAQPGRTEGEVVGEGLKWLSAAGGFAYDIATSSGPVGHRYRHRQALPTWDSVRRLEEGDAFHADLWGPVAHGYYCDLTRSTIIGGKPNGDDEALLERSIALVQHVIEGIEPGRPLSHLHGLGKSFLAENTKGASAFSEMIPFFGHSLGLDCEAPFITATASRLIEPGMVLAVECFLSEGEGMGAGFEHVIHVGPSGLEVLTTDAVARPWARAS